MKLTLTILLIAFCTTGVLADKKADKQNRVEQAIEKAKHDKAKHPEHPPKPPRKYGDVGEDHHGEGDRDHDRDDHGKKP